MRRQIKKILVAATIAGTMVFGALSSKTSEAVEPCVPKQIEKIEIGIGSAQPLGHLFLCVKVYFTDGTTNVQAGGATAIGDQEACEAYFGGTTTPGYSIVSVNDDLKKRCEVKENIDACLQAVQDVSVAYGNPNFLRIILSPLLDPPCVKAVADFHNTAIALPTATATPYPTRTPTRTPTVTPIPGPNSLRPPYYFSNPGPGGSPS